MKTKSGLSFLLILFLSMLSIGKLFAQPCTIKPLTPLEGCAPYTFVAHADYPSSKTVTYYEWNWGAGKSQGNNLNQISILLKDRGCYNVTLVLTYSDNTKCTTQLANKVCVYGLPTAEIILPPNMPMTQCYENNEFTFWHNARRSADNHPIIGYDWNFGDGTTSTQERPKKKYDTCGTYIVSLRVTDTKGCSHSVAFPIKVRILCGINAKFTATGSQGCYTSNYTLKNLTDTNGTNVKKFYWDYEDDGIWDDSTTWTGQKITVTAAQQTVRLRLINRIGCKAETTHILYNFIPKLEVSYDDTVCWEDAKKGVQFHARPIAGATFFGWDFDDLPDPTSRTPFDWDPVHKFTLNGPKNYSVKFTVQHPICGPFDTCVILHVMGPAAQIRLTTPPFSPNDYVPTKKRMPAVYFSLLNNGLSAFPGACDSIPYAYFVPVTKTVTKKSYCNVPVNKILSSIVYCQGTSTEVTHTYPAAYVPLSAATSTKTVNDSVEVWAWYRALQPLPANPYFRSTGSQRFGPNMHDTNLFTCRMPNLVRFSNFSMKYRLYKAIDDIPLLYTRDSKTWDIPTPDTLSPGTHSLTVNLGWPYAHTEEKWSMTVSKQTVINLLTDLPTPLSSNGYIDTCVNKNYPYASDSLRYFWDFGDGDPACTTSVTNNNWDCRFSTLVAPYHYFKTAPPTGCATVQLWVYDDVMGCKDRTTLQLRQVAPDAWWDRGVNGYNMMTWEIQHQNAFRPATPEDETDAFPHLGLRLGVPNQKLNCTGSRYRFNIQANGQILPVCGPQKYWIVFDSAAAVLDTFCKVGSMKVKYRDYGFTGRYGQAFAPAERGISKGYPVAAADDFWNGLPWLGNYWWAQGDTGCKTIGFVVKNGTCYDTAWYHNYICFTRLSPQFSVTRIDTLFTYKDNRADLGKITDTTIRHTLVGTSLDAAEGHLGYRYAHINKPSWWQPRPKETEGTNIVLLPLDREMPRVKKFYFQMERRGFPDNDPFYYNLERPGDAQRGTWPDSPSLNPYRVKLKPGSSDICRLWNRTYNEDSITSIKDTIFYAKYDQNHNLYTVRHYYDVNGNIIQTDTLVIDATRFFLLPKEYSSLKNNGVFYLSSSDMRARPFGWSGASGIPVYYRTKTAGTVPIEDTAFFLDFIDEAKDDAHEYNSGGLRFGLHDSVPMFVPFPGFYTVTSQAVNADGCDVAAVYHFIHGHFAKFWIKGTADDPAGDSIICAGDTVKFNRVVRYWTTNCPPRANGVIPEGCVSGPDVFDGTLPLGEDANIVQVKLYPWDFPDPVAYRQTFLASYKPSNNFRETVEWNYGDDRNAPTFTREPKFGEGYHIYKKPGVYDVTMRTMDTTGHWVYTTRKKLINVVGVDADFVVNPIRDTHSICAPKDIVYRDRTRLLGSDVNEFGKFYQKRKIVAPKADDPACYELRDSAFLMDKIQAWTWTTGQKHQPPIMRTNTDTLEFDYRANGQYDVSLSVMTLNLKPRRCTDVEEKKKYIRIDGPKPRFELLDTAGCVPFVARVRNTSTSSYRYNWYQGDSEVVVSGVLPQDSIVKLIYRKPGRYRITMIQQDTLYDPILQQWIKCTSPEWPDSIFDEEEFWVTVYPFSPIKVGGDTAICPNVPAKYTASSEYGEFVEWKWETSDGQKYSSSNENDSTSIFSWSKPGNYWVAVHGRTERNCEIDDTLHIRVDSIRARFEIDSTHRKHGKFVFINTSVNGVKYQWYAIRSNGQKLTAFTEDKNDKSSKPFEFSDLEPKHEDEAIDTNDLTEFKFQVCLVAYSPIGCPDTFCREIKFPRSFKPWNVITPDDKNSKNDVFDPFIKGETAYNLQIFNRWGERVFLSTSSAVDWNGRVNNTGAPCPAGTYYYVWKFTLVGGVEKTVKGTVSIMRD